MNTDPQRDMIAIHFMRVEMARKWRDSHGGHIFVPNGTGDAVWFPSRYTPSDCLRHPLTSGDGVLNPADDS